MPTARETARQAVLARITDEARRQLARDGAAALSLRSIARELGMVSSGIYRYVESRDELLTMLIVEAYDDLGAAMQRALTRAGSGQRAGWRAVANGLRAWARRHPHEYALIYGSPVPGYAAPTATIGPATRVYRTLAAATPAPSPPRPLEATPSLLHDAEVAAETLGMTAAPAAVLATFGVWTQLFGLVSFELFGHTHQVVHDHDAYFAAHVEAMADALGV